MKIQASKGFTLVEIAIVLVIVGLLIGGVLKGQEMITNAKLKRIESDNAGVAAAMLFPTRTATCSCLVMIVRLLLASMFMLLAALRIPMPMAVVMALTGTLALVPEHRLSQHPRSPNYFGRTCAQQAWSLVVVPIPHVKPTHMVV